MDSVKEQLLALGMKESEIDHYASDLYVLKNKTSDKFVSSYEFKSNVTVFRADDDNKLWYEIPFAYNPRTKR